MTRCRESYETDTERFVCILEYGHPGVHVHTEDFR